MLLLNGHESWKGWEWINKCVENKIEGFQHPANTSNFLQVWDNRISKRFKKNVRMLRDIRMICFGMRIKVMLGIAGYMGLNAEVFHESFSAVKM